MSNSLWPHGQQQVRLPCPSLSSRVCSNSCPLSWWCHLTISPSAAPSPFAFSLSQHQGLFPWDGSWHQLAKVLELQHQSFQWIVRYSGIILGLLYRAVHNNPKHWLEREHLDPSAHLSLLSLSYIKKASDIVKNIKNSPKIKGGGKLETYDTHKYAGWQGEPCKLD